MAEIDEKRMGAKTPRKRTTWRQGAGMSSQRAGP